MSISSQTWIPSWMRQDPDSVEQYDPPMIAELPPPKVSAMPELTNVPEYSQADHDREIFGKAAVMLEQIKRDRDEAQAREDDLKGQLAEAVLARASDSKKIGFLELENSELRNNIQTLQSDVESYRELWSKVMAVLNLWGIKKPEKKRKAKKSSVVIEKVKTPAVTTG